MPTAQNWAIRVQDARVTTEKAFYSWTSSSITIQTTAAGATDTRTPTVAMIDGIYARVTPNGDTIEAGFVCGDSGGPLDIEGRDVITFYFLNGGTYVPYARGYVVQAPNPNASAGLPQPVTVIGLRRALYGVPTGDNREIAEGADLASGVADSLFADPISGGNAYVLPLPYGITYSTFSAIGVTSTGIINPSSVDLGQNLDALVARCEQGGVTAVWGVDPYGTIFFEAKNATSGSFTENNASTRTIIEWVPVQADELCTAVVWVLGAGTTDRKFFDAYDPVSLTTPDVLTHTSESGVTTYGQQYRFLNPPVEQSFLVPVENVTYNVVTGTAVDAWDGSAFTSSGDTNYMHDGDPSTYTVVEGGAGDVIEIQIQFGASFSYASENLVGVRLNLKVDETSDTITLGRVDVDAKINTATAVNPTAALLLGRRNGNTTSAVETGDITINENVLWGDRGRSYDYTPDTGGYVELYVDTVTSGTTVALAIEAFELLYLDTDALDALAEQEYKLPQPTPARVLYGDLYTTEIGTASITKAGGGSLSSLEVTEKKFMVSGARGTETEIVIGEIADREATKLAADVKQRDRDATLKAALAGRRK